MRSKIVTCVVAIEMLIAINAFAQDPGVKLDKASQRAAVANEPQRVCVKEDVQETKLERMVYPVYPPALGKRLDGTVVLHVVVGKSGGVKSARYVSGPPNLKRSAVNAVLQWRYT